MTVQRIQDDEFAVSPRGIHIGHTRTEVDYLTRVIERETPSGLIEVGVHVGGLADELIPKVDNYLGLEINGDIINRTVYHRALSDSDVSLLIVDAWQKESLMTCQLWLADKGPVLIYCDGGKKPVELALYAGITRAGDLIGVHDYGTYEGAEIDPDYADITMRERGFAKYKPSFEPEDVRIAIWRK